MLKYPVVFAAKVGLLLVTVAALAFAQDTGTIFGIVTDASGAVVSGAKVELLDIDRKLATEAVTKQTGEFLFAPVRIGHYELKASREGFTTLIHSHLTLEVQQRMRVDLTLQVGAIGQSVEVKSESPLLETGTSSVGQVIENKAIAEMPLNGRDYQQLAVMTSGAVPSGATSRGPSDFSANGTRPLSNNFLLDGADNGTYILDVQNASMATMQPSVDALQEFKVQNNNFSAEFGRNGGAVINATIKSGTNRFHGTLFEFLRNSVFDANNFFNNRARVGLPPYRQNQFGGTFGGPLIKNKLFFFGSYQGTRVAQGATTLSTVPTQAQHNGVFPNPIYDPATVVPNPNGSGFVRSLFPNNTIPATRFDPTGAKIMGLYPLPNTPGVVNNYILNPSNKLTADQYDNRMDYTLSSRDQLFGRYSYSVSDQFAPGPLPAPAVGQSQGGLAAGEVPISAHSGVLGETHTFGPSIVNEFRGAVNRIDAVRQPQVRERIIEDFGFKGIPYYSFVTGLPSISLTGYQALGEGGTLPNIKLAQVYQLTDSVYIVRNKHSIKFGGDIRYIQSDAFVPSSTRGNYTFTGAFTQNPQSRTNTGSALADALLGLPNAATMTTPSVGDLRQHYFGFYVQDDWQLTSKLTLNVGLRWDLDSPFWDHHDRMTNFITTPGSPDYGKLIVAGSRGDSIPDRALTQFKKTDFAPRFGLAYRLTNKVVLRSAYGIFSNGTTLLGINNRTSNNPPFNASYSYTSDQVNPLFTLATGFPANALVSSLTQINRNLSAIDPNMTNGYIQQWNFAVQDEIRPNLLADAIYSASAGHHLAGVRNVNQPPPGAGATQPRSPFPQYGTINTLESPYNSSYQSLQGKLQRRFSSGWTFIASYTWSHFIDDVQPILDTGGAAAQNTRNRTGERANSNYDVRQRFVTSYAYELPWGQGKKLLNRKGLVNALVGGWQINGIIAAQAGNPFTPTYSVNVANSTGSQRPNRIASGVLPYGDRTVDHWFDTAAFVAPAQYTFGNSGRNILTGPRLFQWDSSLFKMLTLRETLRLQFRAEVFNILNHPDFGVPNAAIGTASAGTISSLVSNATLSTSPVGSPREIQFALKLIF